MPKRRAKTDLQFQMTSDFASLKTVHVELRKRARMYIKAMDRAERLGLTEQADTFREVAARLYRHASLIWPVSTKFLPKVSLPLPEDDWETIHPGVMD